MMKRLDSRKLEKEDYEYITNQEEIWKKVKKFEKDNYDYGKRDGFYEGKEEGKEEGEKNKAKEIACNLIDVLDNETIALKTGLTVEDVKEIREKTKK